MYQYPFLHKFIIIEHCSEEFEFDFLVRDMCILHAIIHFRIIPKRFFSIDQFLTHKKKKNGFVGFDQQVLHSACTKLWLVVTSVAL